MSRNLAHLLMLAAALIWGTTFVAQTTGMDTIGPLSFTSARYAIGALAILPLAVSEARAVSLFAALKKDRKLALQASGLGIMMFGGIALQQTALLYTNVANAAFLTALYVPAVPFFIWVLTRDAPSMRIWLALGLSVSGSWLLSGSRDVLSQWGDFLVVTGALFWAGHIVLIAVVTKKIAAPFQLACLQSVFCVVLAGVPMAVFERPALTDFLPVWPELLYAGLFSVGIAYTLQMVAQRYATATLAAFILSLESVFATAAGWLVLSQSLSLTALLGCTLIFAAIVLADVLPGSWFSFGRWSAPHSRDSEKL